MSAQPRPGWQQCLVMFAIAYLLGYGALRWRKVLVHRDAYCVKPVPGLTSVIPSHPTVMAREHSVIAGRDLRTTGIGEFKNAIAPPLAVIYAPLCWSESVYWAQQERQ